MECLFIEDNPIMFSNCNWCSFLEIEFELFLISLLAGFSKIGGFYFYYIFYIKFKIKKIRIQIIY